MKKWVYGILVLFVLSLTPPSLVRGEEVSPERSSSVEERRLRVSLLEELDRLRQREESLRLREMELKTLEEQVDKKLAELGQLREEMTLVMARKKESESGKVRELAQMYEKMEPGRAAQVMTELEEDLAIGILSAMKKKSAGRILENMPREKASRLSESYPVQGRR